MCSVDTVRLSLIGHELITAIKKPVTVFAIAKMIYFIKVKCGCLQRFQISGDDFLASPIGGANDFNKFACTNVLHLIIIYDE
jgi:hypothetical protein